MDSHQEPVPGKYSGDGSDIFKLAMVTSLLTLVTAGIYRFWAKTRIRKYIWSSVSFRGDSFEYTGTGLEKFLGFLVAIVILAIYLGIIQMVMFFFGLNFFAEPETMEEVFAQMAAFYLTLGAVLPLWFFAIYRARRYKMARTRWRGIRLGMEKGAWGYALRAIGYWILVILTAGILTPLKTFRLEQYMTDRSWYGDARFTQGGDWRNLYPAMRHIFIALGMLVAGGVCLALELFILGVVGFIAGYLWFFIGIVYYRVKSFAYLAENKVLDGKVRFTSEPRTRTILKTVILGGLAVGALAGLLFGIAGGSLGASMTVDPETFQPEFSPAAIVFSVVMYVLALLVVGALTLAFITQPVIQHIVETLTIENPEDLDDIRQRAYDEGADAEGFADALDVGGAI